MKKLKTLGFGAYLALAPLSGQVFADAMQSNNSGNCCAPACCTTPRPCYGYAYNPPTFMADCCGWTAGIDFLYLKFRQEGISYAQEIALRDLVYDGTVVDHDLISGNVNATNKYVENDWDAAFRLSFGYKGACDCWDLNLTYTHYDPSTQEGSLSTNFQATPGNATHGSLIFPAYTALPYFGRNTSLDVDDYDFQEIGAALKLRFNQLDLDASRQYFVGRCVSFKPVVGLRALFIDEKYDIGYEAERVGVGTRDGYLRETLKFENEFRGLGLKAGFDATYDIGCGLSIYGSAVGAMVYGEYEVTQRSRIAFLDDTIGSVDNDAEFYDYQNNSTFETVLAAADLGIGLTWTQLFNCDKSAFTLKVGYEHHMIFNYNQFGHSDFLRNDSECCGGDLAMYGLVFGAGVAF